MENNPMDSKRINEILERTIHVVNEGRSEIFEIAESSRQECELIKRELTDIQQRVKEIVKEVDKIETEERRSRSRLLIVSRDFNKYSEEDIKEAYENANNLRIQLMLKRQEEKNLIQKRQELEMRYKNAVELVKRAEKLITQVGVAMEILTGNLEDIVETIEDMNKRQMLGIKIIQAQEEERQRVARDIHDGPAQSMANVVLKAELCERLLTLDVERAKNELRNLKEIVRESIRDVRKIIYDLRPMSLDDLGLIPTVERYAQKFKEDTGIDVEVMTYGYQRSIQSVIQIAMFRIIQEALNNIRKHSKAKNVKIKIEFSMTNLNVVIEDDGIGFNVSNNLKEDSKTNSGFGIIGMKERAELLEGKLGIKSEMGQGTKIIVTIPINKKEDNYEG
jgi:two-component system sensor histidine kinase DegS